MGVSHSVLLLLDDAGFEPWLQEHGIILPHPWPACRYPTPAEIRAVLDPQPVYRVEYSIGPGLWDAWIYTADQQRTAIWVRNFSGDETVPHEFFFHKGSETLNIQILAQLTPACGAFVLVSDSGIPIVVLGPGQVRYGQAPADPEEADQAPNP
jgi:hypothetical protein